MIVRWGIEELEGLLGELGIERPLLVTSERFAGLDLPVAARFTGVRRHAPLETVSAAAEAALGAEGLVGLGGGSAIDTAKAVSAATGVPLVAVPTTYAGAEWTPYFGMRDEARRLKTGGSGTNTVAVVYEPRLTLDLPVDETVGTAMNALAHSAEALYAGECEHAVAGARLIGRHLHAVVADGHDLGSRTQLLEGAMYAGKALAERGLFLAHAMAQALGGRYGLSHGAMNAVCLAPALRFNAPAVPDAIARLAEALEADESVARVEELAGLGGFGRLGTSEFRRASCARSGWRLPGDRAPARIRGPSPQTTSSGCCARSGDAGFPAPPYDASVVEYISVTAAVSLIALSLGGQVAALPSSNATALARVISVAKEQKVSVSGAKTALARAPYKTPVLRYLYAAGWIGGTKHQRSCLLARISPRTAEEQATGEIRRNAKLKSQLRKRGVLAPTAAGALIKGVVSACS